MKKKGKQDSVILWAAFVLIGLSLFTFGISTSVIAQSKGEKPLAYLPDEFESTAGHTLALANTGVAAMSDISAVRLNPAMIGLEKQYTVSGAYHWPMEGREFYQVGVVDSRTSSVSAGLNYTGFSEDYQLTDKRLQEEEASLSDSPIKRRVVLAFAQRFNSALVGINGQYLEAFSLKEFQEKKVRGTGLGLGIAFFLTPSLRCGASAENLANKKIEDYAPKTYRAGLAYLIPSVSLSLHVDYRYRERVPQEFPEKLDEMTAILLKQSETTIMPDQSRSEPEEEGVKHDPEQMATASFSLGFQNILRFLGAYGQSVDKNDKRRAIAGGIAVVGGKFSLSYAVMEPYADRTTSSHQSVNLNVLVSM